MKKNSNTKKVIKNLSFFVIILGITLGIIFKEQSVTEIIAILKNAKIEFILIGLLCMLIYLLLEAVNLNRTLKVLGEKSSFMQNFKYAIIGFFFSSITPAASGGQPAQIYYMNKNKISARKFCTCFINKFNKYANCNN